MKIKTLKILTILKILTFLISLSAFCLAGFLFNTIAGVIVTGVVLLIVALLLQFELNVVAIELKNKK